MAEIILYSVTWFGTQHGGDIRTVRNFSRFRNLRTVRNIYSLSHRSTKQSKLFCTQYHIRFQIELPDLPSRRDRTWRICIGGVQRWYRAPAPWKPKHHCDRSYYALHAPIKFEIAFPQVLSNIGPTANATESYSRGFIRKCGSVVRMCICLEAQLARMVRAGVHCLLLMENVRFRTSWRYASAL